MILVNKTGHVIPAQNSPLALHLTQSKVWNLYCILQAPVSLILCSLFILSLNSLPLVYSALATMASLLPSPHPHMFNKFFKDFYLFLERGREGERVGEKH